MFGVSLRKENEKEREAFFRFQIFGSTENHLVLLLEWIADTTGRKAR